VVRILEQKGFVAHETFNRSNRYYPLVTREEYMHQQLGRLTKSYFGSARALVSFLVDKKEVSLEDLEAITKAIES
jgi:predicted transcriptional regulator